MVIQNKFSLLVFDVLNVRRRHYRDMLQVHTCIFCLETELLKLLPV